MTSPNVYQSFRCINIMSRIFGVMPLKMMPGDQITGPICLLSKFDYAYSFILLIVSIVHGVMAPFYVLHTNMPHEYEHSIFSVGPAKKPIVNETESQLDEDEVSEMATAMKILNPIMISISCVCSRLVALTFLHHKFSEFITVLHSTDRLMAATKKTSVSNKTAADSYLQTLNKYLL